MRGIHWSPWNSQHKGQWLGAFVFSWSVPKQTVVQTIETPVIWYAIALIMTSLQWAKTVNGENYWRVSTWVTRNLYLRFIMRHFYLPSLFAVNIATDTHIELLFRLRRQGRPILAWHCDVMMLALWRYYDRFLARANWYLNSFISSLNVGFLPFCIHFVACRKKAPFVNYIITGPALTGPSCII